MTKFIQTPTLGHWVYAETAAGEVVSVDEAAGTATLRSATGREAIVDFRTWETVSVTPSVPVEPEPEPVKPAKKAKE